MRAAVLFLTGYRATGKSSVGRELARRLGREFADTDAELEKRIETTIASYFAEHGEEAFRDEESAALESLEGLVSGPGGAIVSTGGGIILRPENVDWMRSRGSVVWLRARPETIRARLESDPDTAAARPGLTGSSAVDEVEAVLESRRSLYIATADHAIETDDLTPAEVVQAILEWVEAGGGT